MRDLKSITRSTVEQWLTEIEALNVSGSLPTYIPKLAKVDPQNRGIYIQSLHDPGDGWGEHDVPLMSVIKPFVLLYCLEQLGTEKIKGIVGNCPSDYPYNSVEQLQVDQGFPRNPMINSGAIALCSHLPGSTSIEKFERFRNWLNDYGQTELFVDRQLLASVESLPNQTNQNLTQILAQSGYLGSPESVALDTYQKVCCLSSSLEYLVQLGLGLVNPQGKIKSEHQFWVTELMQTCGLYEYSAEFASLVGLPTKSGVSGVLLSLVPQQGAIATYSPLLDSMGNSVVGMALLKRIATYLHD
ncbi:MAG: glutaminase [Roseofilum sp. Belize BBD 4]|uniref:glutaminase n=1 Tax=Roseofilum sp. Belize BBD 4 TaxID=2821500 RepID=UPI000E895C8E|nr:glutaminase [Roseofilum sp. Belize BBD 4]MBP0031915.1 glutaminase [Roseofilum sp. Belize BBD 4]HBQ99844.1 glutaminase A [Cyanobacteria bacterium UBA11691]